ncbi:MAG: TIGR01212 family radical SAM protein [Nitrospirae bacterium GWF2_44_13]|nr:MAG: TIGR01212 family radical SAM protein [Nitrospirae bacterium GWF2_44_13]OGW64693.1 MAG: TIGR01212 family radical SAM protein [Nitrospirae bacterium RIFOXYA2_FULL_44_9]OGW73816.1 MAG: TIGR01212 family radical SAM protein [Nitrospirae bacterium RIFOXYC2_FULL_44_7]HBG92111.1 TIGR01212 family radical SAM protein [Nitrospiraceae bacterium]
MTQRYNAFGQYMKKQFGTNVYKVNIDAGFTCPNRDGSLGFGGCIYCNNDSFRPSSCKPSMSVKEQITNGIAYLSRRYKASKFLAYFQPYSNTYAPVEELESLYKEALQEPSVIGLAIGTRPDCIDSEKLALLESLAKKHFILVEYGFQSIYDKTLRFINRGHDYKTFLDAVSLTKSKGIFVGAHLIVGFPTETREETLNMADEVSGLHLDFLKIHQLQVVKDTPLAQMYKENPFHTFEYEEYLDFVVDFIERLSPDIVLQRLFATTPDDMLIAPRWDRSRHQITNDIQQRFIERDTFQGKKYKGQGVIAPLSVL